MLSLHAKTDYIEWIHEPTIPLYNEKKETAVRVNACKYDKNGNKISIQRKQRMYTKQEVCSG